MGTAIPRATAPRQHELDLLRLVAALMVVSAHYVSPLTLDVRSSRAHGAIFDWGEPLATIAQFGVLGVDVFFMISGYVIALSAEGRTAREFLASRAARTLPAFWFCCVLSWSLIALDPGYRSVSPAQLLANLFFVARPLGYPFVDGVYWSLVVELRFYLIVAVLLWWRGMRDYPAFLAAWLALAALDMFGVVPVPLRVALLPQYAPFFVAGGALYLVGRRRYLSWSHLLGAAALLLACVRAEADLAVSFLGQERYVWIAMVATYVAMWTVATRRSESLGRPWMVTAGALTYPLYLLHEDLGFLVMRHFPATGIGWIDHRITITLFALGLFLVAAHAVATWIERPAAARLRRWLAGSGRSAFGLVREAPRA